MPLTKLVKKTRNSIGRKQRTRFFRSWSKFPWPFFIYIQIDNARETVLETNVSTWCIGGTLFQYIDGIFRFCVYYLKKTSPTEWNYEIYAKKMLTIIRFEKRDAELRNVKFEIRIDHKNLKYFGTVKKLTERQIKWVLILSKYDFVINYITGKNNERIDAFFKRKQNVFNENDDKLEYKMVQCLKPRMLNFKKLKLTNQTLRKIRCNRGTLSKFSQLKPEKTGLNFNQLPFKSPKRRWKLRGPRPKPITAFINWW